MFAIDISIIQMLLFFKLLIVKDGNGKVIYKYPA